MLCSSRCRTNECDHLVTADRTCCHAATPVLEPTRGVAYVASAVTFQWLHWLHVFKLAKLNASAEQAWLFSEANSTHGYLCNLTFQGCAKRLLSHYDLSGRVCDLGFPPPPFADATCASKLITPDVRWLSFCCVYETRTAHLSLYVSSLPA
jgi:hypothetical protein